MIFTGLQDALDIDEVLQHRRVVFLNVVSDKLGVVEDRRPEIGNALNGIGFGSVDFLVTGGDGDLLDILGQFAVVVGFILALVLSWFPGTDDDFVPLVVNGLVDI